MMEVRSSRNYHLDAIRALAALSVLAAHWSGLFFVPYREAGSGVLVGIIYIEHYLARGGVICFFALSGYLVGNSVLRKTAAGQWSWKDYLLRRLSRLQMVLVPALFLTLALDLLGQGLFPLAYAQVINNFTTLNFFGCLIFLQQVVHGIEPFGSNGPLWSLSYEFWYYILFPVVVLILLERQRLPLLLAILAAVLWLTFGQVLLLFSCWLAGVGAALLAKKWPIGTLRLRSAMVATSALGFAGVTILCGAHLLGTCADYIFALLAMILIWACLSMPLDAPGSFYARAAIFLSEFSYTLYLTHTPILQFLKAAWLGGQAWKPDSAHLLLACLPLVVVLASAWGFYWLFESRTERVRRFLARRLHNSVPAEAANVSQ